MNRTRLSVVYFIRKNWWNWFNNAIAYNRVDFICICTTITKQNTQFSYKLFTGATESERSMGGCIFGKNLLIKTSNVTERKIMFFDKKLWKSSEFYFLEPGFYSSITDIREAMNTFIQEKPNHNDSCIGVKVSWRKQKLKFTLQLKNLALHFLVLTCETFLVAMLAKKFEWC